MTDKSASHASVLSTRASAIPRFVILLQDWGDKIAGRVLAADHDLVATLDAEGAKWRVATDVERRLAGFVAD